MDPNVCGAMSLVGWLAMLLIWAALIAAVVWGISRLFPDRRGAVPDSPRRGENADGEAPLIESTRR